MLKDKNSIRQTHHILRLKF